MNIFNKLKFIFKKPKAVIVTGEGRAFAIEAIFQVLKPHFAIGDEILVLETDLAEPGAIKKFEFLLKNSSLPILVITHIGNIPVDKNSFSGEKEKTKEIVNLAKTLPSQCRLILNYDDEVVKEIKDEITIKETIRTPEGRKKPSVRDFALRGSTFGFGQSADFRASDVILNSGTNFKINERGSVVPIWLKGLFGKEHIYAALAAAAVGTILGLNLVEISQALKNYQPAAEDKK